MFDSPPDIDALQFSREHVGRDRYSLLQAMLIVRGIETSDVRAAVFEEIKAKNAIVRLADRAYARAGNSPLRSLVLVLYMLRCAIACSRAPSGEARAIAVAGFANEKHTVERMAELLPELGLAAPGQERRQTISRIQARALFRLVSALPRSWRLLGKIARRHSFMPACRIASVLAYYVQMGDTLDQRPEIDVALIASNYSPDAVGLAAAAHRRGRKVVYANHAAVPRNGPCVPPVLADVAVFYGDFMRETYARRSRCASESVLIGQTGESAPLNWRDEPSTVGIFLTALTRRDTVERLVGDILARRPGMRILIRHHPVAMLETDFSDLCARLPNVRITLGSPLSDDIEASDMVVCGNSGVTLNVLRGGRPVAYLPALDELPLDYNGFLGAGLVPRMETWTEETYDELKAFYGNPGWADAMRRQDASYLRPRDEVERQARAKLLGLLGTKPTAPEAAPRMDARQTRASARRLEAMPRVEAAAET